jgi:hypothetical protein
MKKKKKKLVVGGNLAQYGQPVAQGIGMLGSMSGNPVFSSASMGLLAGAKFGPMGMIAGAGIGALKGSQAKHEAELEAKRIKEAQEEMYRFDSANQAIINSGGGLKHGGKLLAKSLNPIKGGGLVPISEDAVEVKGNNPNVTDGVELESAHVDHGEVISSLPDLGKFVFSKELGYAKKAKALEKMKDDRPRFKAVNQKVDQELLALANEQESMKTGKNKTSLAEGGYILRKKLDPDRKQPAKGAKPIEIKGPTPLGDESKYFLNKPKKKLVWGGETDPFDFQKTAEQASMNRIPGVNAQADPFAIDKNELLGLTAKWDQQEAADYKGETITPEMPTEKAQTMPKKFNWGKALQNGVTGLATFGPNLFTNNAIKKLKGPPQSAMERAVTLKKVNPNAQLASARNAFNDANEVVRKGVGNFSNLASGTGSLLAKRLEAENQIFGRVNDQNIGIQNQEAGLNVGVNLRNTERLNRFSENKTEFENKKIQLKSENVANVAKKSLQIGQEKERMALDKLKAKIIAGQYGDSGVLARLGEKFKMEDPEAYEELKSQGFFRLGGLMSNKLSKKKKK